jgi:hypothetical protein
MKQFIEPTDVRDLEQEGVMGHASWSAGVQDAFLNARRDILIEKLRADVARLQEVLADLLKERKNQRSKTNEQNISSA